MGSKELKIFEILVFADSKVVSRNKELYLPDLPSTLLCTRGICTSWKVKLSLARGKEYVREVLNTHHYPVDEWKVQ